MSKTQPSNWQISIFVPAGAGDGVEAEERIKQTEAQPSEPDYSSGRTLALANVAMARKIGGFIGGGHVEKVDFQSIEDQWSNTIETVARLGSKAENNTGDWQVDEITAELTLSAKGELLFIAEAGAQASIRFVLHRRSTGAK